MVLTNYQLTSVRSYLPHVLSHYYLLQVEAEDHRAATLPVLHRRLRRDLLLGALLYIVYGGYTGRHSLASSYHAPNPRTTQQAHYFAPPRAWLGLTAAWPPLQSVRARLRGRRRPRRRLHEPRADLALRALLLEVLPARRAQACDQARVRARVRVRVRCLKCG